MAQERQQITDKFVRSPSRLNKLQPTALPIPSSVFNADLPLRWNQQIGPYSLRFAINYNMAFDFFTLAVNDPLTGAEILRPHPLVYLNDIFFSFQFEGKLRGIHIVPANLGNPFRNMREGITIQNFGSAVKLWYYFNEDEARGLA